MPAVVAKIVFPPPPPTTNTLTYRQRAQLMRTTKKLGRLLGYTPQLIDAYESSCASSSDWSDDEEIYPRPSSRGSTESASSTTSSFRSHWTHVRSPSSRRSSTSFAGSSSSYKEESCASNDTNKPPLLRLALSSPSSPLSSTASDDDQLEDARLTIQSTEHPTRESFISPTFQIPSSASIRRQKMDRIRKKLGDGVPVDLVFPEPDEPEQQAQIRSPLKPTPIVTSVQHRQLPPLPSPSSLPMPGPRPRSPKSRTQARGPSIPNARDSLIVGSTPHRAHRIKRKPVPQIIIETEPELESTDDVTSPSVDVNAGDEAGKRRVRVKDRLSLILEVPCEFDQDHEGLESPLSSLPSSPSSPSSAEGSEVAGLDWEDFKRFLRFETEAEEED